MCHLNYQQTKDTLNWQVKNCGPLAGLANIKNQTYKPMFWREGVTAENRNEQRECRGAPRKGFHGCPPSLDIESNRQFSPDLSYPLGTARAPRRWKKEDYIFF